MALTRLSRPACASPGLRLASPTGWLDVGLGLASTWRHGLVGNGRLSKLPVSQLLLSRLAEATLYG